MKIFEKIENARLKWSAVLLIEAFGNVTVQNIIIEWIRVGFVQNVYLSN